MDFKRTGVFIPWLCDGVVVADADPVGGVAARAERRQLERGEGALGAARVRHVLAVPVGHAGGVQGGRAHDRVVAASGERPLQPWKSRNVSGGQPEEMLGGASSLCHHLFPTVSCD